VDWVHLAQGRDQWRGRVNTVTDLRVPQNAGSFLTNWVTISFWRRTLLHEVSYFTDLLPELSTRLMSLPHFDIFRWMELQLPEWASWKLDTVSGKLLFSFHKYVLYSRNVLCSFILHDICMPRFFTNANYITHFYSSRFATEDKEGTGNCTKIGLSGNSHCYIFRQIAIGILFRRFCSGYTHLTIQCLAEYSFIVVTSPGTEPRPLSRYG
jgi:hypothetical protein